jgi:hypothetical protein
VEILDVSGDVIEIGSEPLSGIGPRARHVDNQDGRATTPPNPTAEARGPVELVELGV